MQTPINESESIYPPYLYEMTHRGNPGDTRFYLRACQDKENILELGCGTGRLLFPIAEQGHNITGIDNSSEMLAFVHKKIASKPPLQGQKIELQQADIRDFFIHKKFDRILLPFNVLYCLLSVEDVTNCLTRVKEHLAPGGSCIFDLHIADEEDLAEINADEWEAFGAIKDDEQYIQIYERRIWDKETQRVDAFYQYRIREDGRWREEEYCIPQCYLTPEQMEEILDHAGLFPTQVFGDFRGNSFTEESENLIVWAKSK